MARPLHKRQCKYKVKSSNALPPNINIVVLTHTESLYFEHVTNLYENFISFTWIKWLEIVAVDLAQTKRGWNL